jgi:hypothetical protein
MILLPVVSSPMTGRILYPAMLYVRLRQFPDKKLLIRRQHRAPERVCLAWLRRKTVRREGR